jgi:hypothetical protein
MPILQLQEYAEEMFLSKIFFCKSGRKFYFQKDIFTTLIWTLKSVHKCSLDSDDIVQSVTGSSEQGD